MSQGPRPESDDRAPRSDLEALFLAHLGDVDRIVRLLAAQKGLSPDECDDFQGWVHMKLVEDDYAILRKHEGRSAMRSYLSVVIARLLLDRRIQKWGKWRPSAVAGQAGPLGIRLERLVRRDGLSIDAAIRVLRSRGDVPLSDRALTELAASFPHRSRPRIEADPDAVGRAADDHRTDEIVLAEERERRQTRVMDRLEDSIAELGDEDRVILRLKFWEGSSVADIARALQLDQRPLYRRLPRLLARLRASLEARGISGSDVTGLLTEGDA